MSFIVLQNNCEGFWSWSWAYPIILAFILGIILGWLLSRLFKKSDSECECCIGIQAELDACRSNVKLLSNRTAQFQKTEKLNNENSLIVKDTEESIKSESEKEIPKKTEAKKEVSNENTLIAENDIKESVNNEPEEELKKIEIEEDNKVEDTSAKPILEKKSTKKDDLTKVEGIGPKIQEHFNNGGIFTWEELSKTAVSRLQEILDAAGPRYRIHNPASWPLQAGMCARGEWEKLEQWQSEHKGGRF